jgi:hypothetical protein
VLAGLKFVPVHTMDEVLAAALTSVPDVQKALLEGGASVGTQLSQ